MSSTPSPVPGTSPPPSPAPVNDPSTSPPAPPSEYNPPASSPGGGGTGGTSPTPSTAPVNEPSTFPPAPPSEYNPPASSPGGGGTRGTSPTPSTVPVNEPSTSPPAPPSEYNPPTSSPGGGTGETSPTPSPAAVNVPSTSPPAPPSEYNPPTSSPGGGTGGTSPTPSPGLVNVPSTSPPAPPSEYNPPTSSPGGGTGGTSPTSSPGLVNVPSTSPPAPPSEYNPPTSSPGGGGTGGTSPTPSPAPGNDSFVSPRSPPFDSNKTASPQGGGGTGVLASPPKKGLSTGVLTGLIVGLALAVLIFVGIFVFFYRRKKRKAAKLQVGPPQYWQQSIPPARTRLDSETSPVAGIEVGFSQNTFSLEELTTATDGFCDANLLGQGGFGYVHKGVLSNGKVVAIKQLKAGSGQGEREFRAEIEIISRVHHRYLVSLVGYCITGAQRMLVYEFVPNGTLEFHLHGKDKPTMDWSTRMKIAVGAAKGLAYLHEDCRPKIIHRDIKAANILLDYSFEPKVADFGLAKHSLDTDTHVSTRVMGTIGYMAPEYASTGRLTDKSDVFSFGVVLLELITGHRPVDRTLFLDGSIVDWARPLMKRALEDENYNALVGSKLQNYDYFEMKRMICCAAACVRHSARLRPSMSQIVLALEGSIPLDELSDGIPPGQSMAFRSHGSSDYSPSQFKGDLKNFSEYSVPTSDFGLQPSSSSTEGQSAQEKDSQGVEKNARDSHHPSS